jgi:hypothetical protein
VAAMTAWLEAHLEQAALCGRGECDHHV